MLKQGERIVMKQPSRKGKPNRIKIDYTLKHAYQYYKDNVELKLQLPEKVFIRLCKECNTILMNKIVLDSDAVSMPGRLGEIRIAKRPMEIAKNRIRVDWFNSKKAGKLIYHLNEHSNGWRYRWYWTKPKLPNGGMYSFTAVRKHIRHIPKAIKVYKKDYFI